MEFVKIKRGTEKRSGGGGGGAAAREWWHRVWATEGER